MNQLEKDTEEFDNIVADTIEDRSLKIMSDKEFYTIIVKKTKNNTFVEGNTEWERLGFVNASVIYRSKNIMDILSARRLERDTKKFYNIVLQSTRNSIKNGTSELDLCYDIFTKTLTNTYVKGNTVEDRSDFIIEYIKSNYDSLMFHSFIKSDF